MKHHKLNVKKEKIFHFSGSTDLQVLLNSWSLPGGSSGKEPACQCRRHKRCRFEPWVGKIPWRRKWQPAPIFLPGKFHGQKSLAGYSMWDRKEIRLTTKHIEIFQIIIYFLLVVFSLISIWPEYIVFWGFANCCPGGQTSVFISDILLEHSHTHLFMYYLWLLSCYNSRMNSYDIRHLVHELK